MAELQESVSEIGAQGGHEEFLEYYTQKKGPLITLLRNYSAKLNSFYQTVASEDTDITQLAELRRQQMMNQIRTKEIKDGQKIEDFINEILTESGKGGADILKKGLQKKFELLEKQQRREVYTELQKMRDDVYHTGQITAHQQEFKALVLEGMRIIYKIREEFTGVSEEIAIVFKEGTYAKMVRVPMDAYLAHANEWTRLTLEGFSKELAGDPFKLQMKKNKDIINKLIKLSGKTEAEILTTIDIYKELKQNIHYFREDKKYLVVAPGQGGFVAEALIRASVNDTQFTYRQDREAWYQEADVLIEGQKRGISVKSFLDSSPTLIRINSLHKIINDLINALSSNQPPGDIVSYIRKNIFHATEDIDAAMKKRLEDLVQESLHV